MTENERGCLTGCEWLRGVKYWRMEKGIKCELPKRLVRSRMWLF